jgi:hypothetical protein
MWTMAGKGGHQIFELFLCSAGTSALLHGLNDFAVEGEGIK